MHRVSVSTLAISFPLRGDGFALTSSLVAPRPASYRMPTAKYTKRLVRQGDGAFSPTYSSSCTLLIEPLGGGGGAAGGAARDCAAASECIDLAPYCITVADGGPCVAQLGFGETEAAACIDDCLKRMRCGDVVDIEIEAAAIAASDAAAGACRTRASADSGGTSVLAQCVTPVAHSAVSSPQALRLTLVSFVPAPLIYEMTCEEKTTLAKSNKDTGVRLYSAALASGRDGGIRRAYYFFSMATKLFLCAANDAELNDLDAESRTAASKCYLNMAMCQLRWQLFADVVANCKRALSLGSDCRAHHRLGLAYHGLRDLDSAKASFEQALKMNPSYKEAQTELARVAREMKDSDSKLAVNLRKMF